MAEEQGSGCGGCGCFLLGMIVMLVLCYMGFRGPTS